MVIGTLTLSNCLIFIIKKYEKRKPLCVVLPNINDNSLIEFHPRRTREKKVMDLVLMSILLLSFAGWAWILNIIKFNFKKSAKFPPGPSPYPIIGNILELGKNPHQSLAKLSKIYGPLIYLKLGSLDTVVVSSPEMAKIVLQKYDQVFSNRKEPDAARALDHHKLSMVWLPVEAQWRKLRKICKEQMFSVPSLDANQGLRKDKLKKLFDYVSGRSVSGEAVDIGKAAFTTSLNLMSATLFSKEVAAFDSNSSQELKEIVWALMEIIGRPNISDYFPVFKLVDPQGVLRRSTTYFKKCLDILEAIIDERLKSRGKFDHALRKNDMLESLLDISRKSESELSSDDIKHLLVDLFVAGADTTSGTVEWALSELLRNPDKMLKAKEEIRNVVGKNEQVQESDISSLPYLRAVVKETFRLHPAGPLSLPHMPAQDVEINGYIVPKNAQILVNLWAIGRDSSTWSDPDSFMPERFLERETDFKGQHFELIPFGAGRRICPGLPLANRMVHLMVATLIHNFDWKLAGGLKPEELDMTERFGLSLQKVVPLKAVPSIA